MSSAAKSRLGSCGPENEIAFAFAGNRKVKLVWAFRQSTHALHNEK
jgi:hypothetical protein